MKSEHKYNELMAILTKYPTDILRLVIASCQLEIHLREIYIKNKGLNNDSEGQS